MLFFAYQPEEGGHRIAYRLPSRRNMICVANVDRVVSIPCKSFRRNETSRDTWLEKFAITNAMRVAYERAGVGAPDDRCDVRFNSLEGLPVATCGKCVARRAVVRKFVRIPAS
jgi:hypothetical protein